jgi:hypothetical protein
VIEVNGLNVVKGDGMKETVDNQGARTKKVPPLPPPKKFYSESKSLNDGSLNSVARDDDDAGSQVGETHDEQNENGSNEMQDEAAASYPKSRSTESIDAVTKLEEHFVREKSPLEDASSEDGVLPDDEEPYYDSVALDGEYVYLQTGMYRKTATR